MADDDGFPSNCSWTPAAKREFLEHERQLDAAAKARDWRTKQLQELSRRVRELEQVVAALPGALGEVMGKTLKNQNGMRYGGIHDADLSYRPNTLVTCSGSLWIALTEAEKGARPGKSPAWRLVAKAGSAAPQGFA